MITKWKLFNFKSISKETELEFGPLTIFAGANSSGKSTVLQSILLISQTLSSKVKSRSVVLNGSLVKLGQFDDLKSYQREAKQILVGWECRPQAEDMFSRLTCEFSFDVDESSAQYELAQLQPQLFACSLGIFTDDFEDVEVQSHLSVRRSIKGRVERIRELDLQALPEEISTSLDYDIEIDAESDYELTDDGSPPIVGCTLNHFLPERLAARYDTVKAQARTMTSELLQPFRTTARRAANAVLDIVIPDDVVLLLKNRLQEQPQLTFESKEQPSVIGSGLTIREWQSRLKALPVAQQRQIRNQLVHEDLATQIQGLLVKDRPSVYDLNMLRPPPEIAEGIAYQRGFFAVGIRYLGPLRDEPKPLYPLAANVDPADVGLRGEHTAAVLDLHKNQYIRYIPSTHFTEPDIPIDNRISNRTLQAAVLDWLQYMSVVEGLETHDRGKLGHELKVITAGTGMPHDLTHVGVGVSQVLPIVVMCLLANPDATIIIEQPELHLHPKVQTLLGDFFLAMAMLDKQIIIETHSEYIINRLRFRAASATRSDVSPRLKIYFAEKKEGSSQFRSVDVNKYGAIVEWPDGFFDQSQDEAEKILRAATRKKKSEHSGDKDAKRND